jgi:HK97 family phage major capsid protein
MPNPDEQKYAVTRDFTATRGFLDQVRAVSPACHICGKPSGYKDLERRWSHQICADEGSTVKRAAKIAALTARGGKIPRDAGEVDLEVVTRMVERNSEGPRAALKREQPRDLSVTRNSDPLNQVRRAQLIKLANERDIYDLGGMASNPFNPSGKREVVDKARRAVDLADLPTARDQAAAKDHIDKLLCRSDRLWEPDGLARRILTTGSRQYRDLVGKMITAGMRGYQYPLGLEDSRLIQRAMSVGTGSTGGFAVSFQLDPTIVPTSNGSVNPYRQVCRTVITSSNEWRQAYASGVTLAYSLEAVEAVDNSPTLAQSPLIPKRVVGFVPLSRELNDDWGEAEAQLGNLINDAKDDLEATKFATGTGTNEPAGMVTGATNVTVVGATFDVAADLYLAETNLAARFRPRAQWFGNRAQYQLIRQFVQPESSAPIIDHVVGGDTEVIGYRANEASGMTALVTSGSKILILGDPQYFIIVDHVGLDLEIASHLFGGANRYPTGQRGLVIYYRNTSAVLDPAAFRTLAIT